MITRALNHGNSWTPADEANLRDLYPATKGDRLAEIFGRSKKALNSRAKVLGLKKAIGHGGQVAWTRKMDRQLRALYPDNQTPEVAMRIGASPLAIYQRAQKLRIRKSEAYIERKRADERNRLSTSGVAHRYPKGHAPQNKGTRRPGWFSGRMRETQFRKGQVSPNTMPMWCFRFVDGYLMLKTGAPTPKPTTGWEYVHKLIWEQANGPLPDWRDARLWWKDGDHRNCALSNLELVTAQEHMTRTTIHRLPPDLKSTIFQAGVLKRRIREYEEAHAEKQAV